jgi:hypothetical protein
MTHAEWLRAEDPVVVLYYLPARPSDRKLRLFACACCRRVWHLFADPRQRSAVEAAERFADALLGKGELAAARAAAKLPTSAYDEAGEAVRTAALDDARQAAKAARYAANARAQEAARAASVGTGTARDISGAVWAAERWEQATLLRDIAGHLWRPAATASRWADWDGGTVRKLAEAVYEENAYDRLPILADALEDAGCTDAELLGHCRSGGEHVRGCWVVDLVLGRE